MTEERKKDTLETTLNVLFRLYISTGEEKYKLKLEGYYNALVDVGYKIKWNKKHNKYEIEEKKHDRSTEEKNN